MASEGVAPGDQMPKEDRVASESARTMAEQAEKLDAQGKYAAAQPLYEKALEINRRLLTDDYPLTAHTTTAWRSTSPPRGSTSRHATDGWRGQEPGCGPAPRRLHRPGTRRDQGVRRPALAAVLARLGQPAEAWQSLEEDLGRGLLDELAARQDLRLAPAERARLRELTAELERLDRLVETTPKVSTRPSGPSGSRN